MCMYIETKRDRDREKDCVNGSHDYGGQEILQSAICKLYNQQTSGAIQFTSKHWEVRSIEIQGQKKMMFQLKQERKFTLFLPK